MTEFIIGVIADTHIPDRARSLDFRVLPVFQDAGVQAILHAGDISTRSVLAALEQLAPVYAVRGNRDWIALHHLPGQRRLTIDGVSVGLVHGHGKMWDYLSNRIEYILRGYRLMMFLPRLLDGFPDVKVIVFGHTHRPLNRWINGQLVFNPGSPHFPQGPRPYPSVGLLRFTAGGSVTGEIVRLD